MTDSPTTPSSSSNSNSNLIATHLNAINLAAYISNVGLVNFTPTVFNVPDNAEISGKYQTLVTPAGWAFAIWGIIFLVQAIWAVVQFASSNYQNHPLVVQGVGLDYVWVCFFQVTWIFAFALEQINLSLFLMVGILVYLVRIYERQQSVTMQQEQAFSLKEYWLLKFPFGIHLGWICAATLVNINLVLVAHSGVVSTGLRFYAAIFSIVTTLIVTTLVLFRQAEKQCPDVVIPLVLVWALNAISKELSHPKDSIFQEYSISQVETVQNGAATAALLILVSSAFVLGRGIWKNRTTTGHSSAQEERLLNE